MTYALISDIHGNMPALQAVLDDARGRNVQQYIFLGDYCLGLAYPNEVLDCIRSINSKYVIGGNEEDAIAGLKNINPSKWPIGQFETYSWYYNYLSNENRQFIFSLPHEIIIKADNVPSLFTFHKPERYFLNSSPSTLNPQNFAKCIDDNTFTVESFKDYSDKILEEDSLLIEQLNALKDGIYIFGHKHIQWSKKIGDKMLISPGSCGLSLDFQQSAAYATLHWNSLSWECELRRVYYDVPMVYKEMSNSKCAKEHPVWFGVISREMLTAREQAIPFLKFTENYANSIGDSARPFVRDTWYASFAEWEKINQL